MFGGARWVDETSGLECQTARHETWWVAYVTVPREHPAWGRRDPYMSDEDDEVDGTEEYTRGHRFEGEFPYGDITYSKKTADGKWKFGIDTAGRPVEQSEAFITRELMKVVRTLTLIPPEEKLKKRIADAKEELKEAEAVVADVAGRIKEMEEKLAAMRVTTKGE